MTIPGEGELDQAEDQVEKLADDETAEEPEEYRPEPAMPAVASEADAVENLIEVPVDVDEYR